MSYYMMDWSIHGTTVPVAYVTDGGRRTFVAAIDGELWAVRGTGDGLWAAIDHHGDVYCARVVSDPVAVLRAGIARRDVSRAIDRVAVSRRGADMASGSMR